MTTRDPNDSMTSDELFGAHTRQRCPEALYDNNARVMKCNSEANDTHPNGSIGTVIGSIGVAGMVGYFVAWDAHPNLAVFTAELKLGPVQ